MDLMLPLLFPLFAAGINAVVEVAKRGIYFWWPHWQGTRGAKYGFTLLTFAAGLAVGFAVPVVDLLGMVLTPYGEAVAHVLAGATIAALSLGLYNVEIRPRVQGNRDGR